MSKCQKVVNERMKDQEELNEVTKDDQEEMPLFGPKEIYDK